MLIEILISLAIVKAGRFNSSYSWATDSSSIIIPALIGFQAAIIQLSKPFDTGFYGVMTFEGDGTGHFIHCLS